ncbi:MAG: hypothetical protein IJV72_05910 [Clostridia bacterium]|nr:hypothetical protein [Clostridia bacterium]
MRLGMNEIKDGIYQAALNRTMRQLHREGFQVNPDYYFENAQLHVDLFAHNEVEKRIYEFKFGRNRIQRNQLFRLQDFAKHIGAKLYVIYLEMPQSKEIIFDGIEGILYKNLSEYPPQEICELSTHFYIREVDNVDISSIDLSNELVNLSGSARLIVELQFGSRSDRRNGDGFEETVEFDFTFRLKLDVAERSIMHSYYKFDTSWYYDDN